jgi:hypothetical protein
MNWKPMAFSAAAGLVLFALPTHAQTDRDPMILLFIHKSAAPSLSSSATACVSAEAHKTK